MEQDLITEREPAIISPDIVLTKEDDKIVHTLIDDALAEMDLIPTTEIVKNMEVVYDEIFEHVN